ncbi:hypothetical protein [Gracilimonas mengyeensis]|uniref:Addiction module component n=1 Tax=Gracilimonas mengyeensis TaxID=1302730 RepID=A0A521E2I0_9BACT|nr:hypothetical protein [Gracilimonas mengyeensis]SMO78148.1 hypothetical protein SAMN06265219_110100 [Gracilimonas mengyeensis]
MDTLQKEKKELLNWIESVEDPQILEDIRSVRESQKAIHWDSLPDEIKEGIQKGRKDAKDGRVTDHKEVRKSYEKWL